ncbi:MAG TPA: hypothetical protein VMZ53_24355 [Kofleriaceae bacterium]|nr:hypothetical protein [Kofleriaceae bacterium]
MSYRNDHDAALARIAALEHENAQLKRELEGIRAVRRAVFVPQRDWIAVGLAGLTGLAFGLCVLATSLS